jgi:hypothetical protein
MAPPAARYVHKEITHHDTSGQADAANVEALLALTGFLESGKHGA